MQLGTSNRNDEITEPGPADHTRIRAHYRERDVVDS